MSCVQVPPNTHDLIKDVHSPDVVEAGKVAVEEHNKKENDNLVFIRVVSAIAPRALIFIKLWSFILVIEAKTCNGFPVTYVVEIDKYLTIPEESYKLIRFEAVLEYK
ncbi:hypothetical protein Csa_004738 [Cucumis sativus]|nr:hypothetical protein Csa_004738 [Cucumis sativus]